MNINIQQGGHLRNPESRMHSFEIVSGATGTQDILHRNISQTAGGFHDKLRYRHALGDIYLELYTSLHIYGHGHLSEIRNLHASTRKIMMIGNHRSNADAPVLEHTLEKTGYADLGDDLVFLLGQKLKQSRGTQFFSMAYPHIDVWPPTMSADSDEEKSRMRRMMKNTLMSVNKAYETGKIIVAFGESTRTRDPQLKMSAFLPQIGHYLKGKDTYVVPFALMGTETIWPVCHKAPQFRQKNSAHLVVGEPFLSASYMAGHGHDRYANVMIYAQERVQEMLDEYSFLEQ